MSHFFGIEHALIVLFTRLEISQSSGQSHLAAPLAVGERDSLPAPDTEAEVRAKSHLSPQSGNIPST